MKRSMLFSGFVLVMAVSCLCSGAGVRLVTDRSLELTGFQDAGPYNPYCDFRNDFAMVYGADNPKLPEFIQ